MARFLVPQRSFVVRRQSTLEATLPEGHLARFIWAELSAMDFTALEAHYASIQGGPGRSPYHPRVLVALWIYGMTQGIGTAVGIAMACLTRDDFRWLAGGLCPSDQTLLNLLPLGPSGLTPIWVQMLHAMHAAGHIDLSALAEDGTKLRANASPRSFVTAAEIEAVIAALTGRLDVKLQELAQEQEPDGGAGKLDAEGRALSARLRRARKAASELRERADRRERTSRSAGAVNAEAGPPADLTPCHPEGHAPAKFSRADFQHDAERDVLICPAQRELTLVGTYAFDSSRGSDRRYRLYRLADCGGCALKPQCTEAKGRRVKVPVNDHVQPTLSPSPHPTSALSGALCMAPPTTAVTADGNRAPMSPETTGSPTPSASAEPAAPTGGEKEKDEPEGRGPRASLTEPEAVMMLATSEKRWEPSYNADLTVTRHGVIVSQFLTKRPTDYHAFATALPAVLATVGRPDCWIGDGHYGTQANLVLADQEGVVLYAPPAGRTPATPSTSVPTPEAQPPPRDSPPTSPPRYGRTHFRPLPDRDVLLCPNNQELRLLGVYPTDNRLATYRLYGRRDCTGCERKSQCTDALGRRVKIPQAIAPPPLADDEAATAADEAADLGAALRNRMDQVGDRVLRFRRETVEPVNAQLKQHGVRRFYVHGLARCAAVLTLACIAHNLMKWKAREAVRVMRLAA